MSERRHPATRHLSWRMHPAALGAVLVAVALIVAVAAPPDRAEAQAPPATEEQALSIERQLMCPQCPNERLDTCERAVCRDMKRIIREQLADGRTPDDIILFFEMRYGPRVRADLPAEGFNLLLFGWVGGSLAVVAAGAAWYLWSLRRRSSSPIPDATAAERFDDAWLDAQLGADQSGGARETRER